MSHTTQTRPPQEMAKKSSDKHFKSAYRDARFRPLFHALSHLEAERDQGRTSVIYATPFHPSHSIIRLKLEALPALAKLGPYPLRPEPLSDKEAWEAERHLRHLNVVTPRKQRTPAHWRDLSDISRIEWFHHRLRLNGHTYSFSGNLRTDVAARLIKKASAGRWLQDRITKRLHEAFGFSPDFWFVIEESDNKKLHIHGEVKFNADTGNIAVLRKALRLACGEWEMTRQHQSHLSHLPNVGWSNYCTKDAGKMRARTSGSMFGQARPISGSWYGATNNLRKSANALYSECRVYVIAALSGLARMKTSPLSPEDASRWRALVLSSRTKAGASRRSTRL